MRLALVALTGLALWSALAGCTGGLAVPDPPWLLWASPGSGLATLHFVPPLRTGQAPVEHYLARCAAGGMVSTATGHGSPLVVRGLANHTAYVCSVQASSSAGSSAASRTLDLLPQPAESDSLAAGYRQMRWAPGITVQFVGPCSMVVFTDGRPDHATASQYLQPLPTPDAPAAGTTTLSGIKLAFEAHDRARATRSGPLVFDICPVRAARTTATREGMVGLMSSGAALFAAGEIPGHRASAPADAVKMSDGTADTSLLDGCNGHPTPRSAGGVYHYHGLSACLRRQVDSNRAPSRLIGIALDGFPIYDDRDIDGKRVPLAQLDACNGINSPTPEFPNGVYHYVLPEGATDTYASLRCLAGTVSERDLAAARASGFCYVAGNDSMNPAAHAQERVRRQP